jgi:hypothetical protein
MLQPNDVLLRDRQIEMQLAPQRLYRLFGRKWPKLKARRIAGKKAHECESDERNEEDLRHKE